MYETKCWTIVSVVEMKILCQMCGKTKYDKIINDNMRGSVGVAYIEEKYWKIDLGGLCMQRENLQVL